MKNQALFSSKDKSKKLKCRLLQFLFGALWVKSRSHVGKERVALTGEMHSIKSTDLILEGKQK